MLPKSNRVPSQNIRHVLGSGTRYILSSLDLSVLKCADIPFRCSIIVSTRIDKRATVRNRIRRLISESVRKYIPHLSPGCDVVIRVKRRLPDTYSEVDVIVKEALIKAGTML